MTLPSRAAVPQVSAEREKTRKLREALKPFADRKAGTEGGGDG